jgi:hypothetical protein
MDGIDITGDLVIDCLVELKLTEILGKLKEIAHDIEEIEGMLDSQPDYNAYARAIHRLR